MIIRTIFVGIRMRFVGPVGHPIQQLFSALVQRFDGIKSRICKVRSCPYGQVRTQLGADADAPTSCHSLLMRGLGWCFLLKTPTHVYVIGGDGVRGKWEETKEWF